MSGVREQVAELLRLAQGMSHGPEQVSVCERAVNLADGHHDVETGFVARRRLIQAATFSGMPDKSMVAFAWCLAQCDRDPERFSERRVLWQYKWVVMSLYGFPEIPRGKIEQATADIEDRYRRQGLSPRPIWRIRLINARGMGDTADAEHHLQQWLAAPRDEFTDCRACETSTHVGVLVDAGADEEALAVARPLLDGRLGCATQPQITLARVLMPLLRLGRIAEAVPRHVDGYRRIRAQPHYYTTTIAQHLVFLALTGNYGRALRVLEEHLGRSFADPTPIDRLHFYLAGRLALELLDRDGQARIQMRLPSSFPAHRREGEYDTLALADWFATELSRLAQRFDARNGNGHYGQLLGRHLELRELARAHPIG